MVTIDTKLGGLELHVNFTDKVLNVYKKTQYSISMGCDIKNCNKWIPELEKIVSSFKVD